MISRLTLLSIVVGSVVARAWAAEAPEALANVIYHEQYRGTYDEGEEQTALRGDGTALSFLRMIAGRFTTPVQPGGEGTFMYAKTGPATATLSITDQAGHRVTRTLTFSTDVSGSWAPEAPDATQSAQTFSLRPLYPAWPLVNSSSRTSVSADRKSIMGFVVTGGTRRVLVRVIGPGLRAFDVASVAEQCVLEVFSANGARLATNSGWDQNETDQIPLAPIFRLVGAFPLAAGSADAAVLLQLPAGAYTVHASSGGVAGEVLSEVYVLP